MNKYYGLIPLAEKYVIFKKVSTRYELPDGTKLFGKAIMQNPEKHFTEEIMLKIDKYCQEKFLYGTTETETNNEEVVQNGEESSE